MGVPPGPRPTVVVMLPSSPTELIRTLIAALPEPSDPDVDRLCDALLTAVDWLTDLDPEAALALLRSWGCDDDVARVECGSADNET